MMKSTFIAKKLYFTRQVKPLPEVRACAFTLGVKRVDNEAKLSVNITAEIVI